MATVYANGQDVSSCVAVSTRPARVSPSHMQPDDPQAPWSSSPVATTC